MLDFLIGRKNLNKIEASGNRYAHAKYNTSQADPMIDLGMTQATEGLDVDSLRESMLSEVYRQRPSIATGMSQGHQLALDTMQDGNRMSAQVAGDTQIGLADSEVKRQGQMTLAEGLTNRAQLQANRDAAIAENRMQIEAEAGRRKGALLAGAMNLASAAINPSSILGFVGGRVPLAPGKPKVPVKRPMDTGPNSLHTTENLLNAEEGLNDLLF